MKLHQILIFILGMGLLASLASCEKKADVAYFTSPAQLIGQQFTYPTQDFANDFSGFPVQPINPFTVDSVAPNAYHGYNGYYVSSANHVKLIIDPVFITNNLIK